MELLRKVDERITQESIYKRYRTKGVKVKNIVIIIIGLIIIAIALFDRQRRIKIKRQKKLDEEKLNSQNNVKEIK